VAAYGVWWRVLWQWLQRQSNGGDDRGDQGGTAACQCVLKAAVCPLLALRERVPVSAGGHSAASTGELVHCRGQRFIYYAGPSYDAVETFWCDNLAQFL